MVKPNLEFKPENIKVQGRIEPSNGVPSLHWGEDTEYDLLFLARKTPIHTDLVLLEKEQEKELRKILNRRHEERNNKESKPHGHFTLEKEQFHPDREFHKADHIIVRPGAYGDTVLQQKTDVVIVGPKAKKKLMEVWSQE